MGKSTEIKKTEAGKKDVEARGDRPLAAFDEMDRMFERFLGRPFARSWLRPLQLDWPEMPSLAPAFEGRIPKVDVIDRDKEVLVRAELPGVEKNDLDIAIHDNAVTIRATTKQEKKEEKENYYHRELSRGEFVRTVQMPTEVDSDKAKASFKNGLLEITLPKSKESSRRKINVD